MSDEKRVLPALIRSDLLAHIQKVFETLNGGAELQPYWHIYAIVHALTACLFGDTTRLIIYMPPRYLKSLCVSMPDRNLIDLIARTRRWFVRITKGETVSVREIAREEGMDEGDVSRFLPLAFLAPDIVESILAGKQPVELTAEKLKRFRNLPHSWEEKRRLLGFAA
jgi:hypothetical protein